MNKNLYRIPIGYNEKGRMFEILQNMSHTQLRLYCVICLKAITVDNSLDRYIDYSTNSLDELFKLADISYKTGMVCIKKLEEQRLIDNIWYKNFVGQKVRLIKLPYSAFLNCANCNLEESLYNIIENQPSSVALKVYVFNCFLREYNFKKHTNHKCTLKALANNIGVSKTNLTPIIQSNRFLNSLSNT